MQKLSVMRHIYMLMAAAVIATTMPLHADNHIKLKTVAIDPGHGGHDAGCVSRDRKTYEKTIALDISRRLSEKIRAAYPDVKVIMTRSDDRFIQLDKRAGIANKAGADLFISIHINSVERGTTANGYSIHCLGQSSRKGNDLFSRNMDLCRRENSVITLEDDYTTRYQGFDPNDPESYIIFSLVQNSNLENSLQFAEDANAALASGPIKHSRGISQDPFLVLWTTTMPAVLVECGFMSNPSDLATLRSKEGRDGIADGLFRAFKTYKTRIDGSSTAPAKVESHEVKAEAVIPENPAPSDEAAPTDVFYGTQVLATKKALPENDPYFAGFDVRSVTGPDQIIRYFVGTSEDLETAKKKHKEVTKKIRDGFFVKVERGKIVRQK